MMTPQEVANCTFTKAVMGGYNMASVDDFLDKLTEDYSVLYKENASLKAKMKVLVDKMEEYREVEDAMRSTLLTAQKMANSMVAEAEAKRDALIADSAGAAKQRLAEIEQELAAEEQRLADVRREVDGQIEVEHKRLAAAQEDLRRYIQTVQSVCQEQLSLLELLPELPVEAPAPAAPAEAEPVQPGTGGEDAVVEAIDAAVEKNIQDVIAAFQQTGGDEEAAPEAGVAGDPFADDGEGAGSTRVLNLDDLQFGRNYTRE